MCRFGEVAVRGIRFYGRCPECGRMATPCPSREEALDLLAVHIGYRHLPVPLRDIYLPGGRSCPVHCVPEPCPACESYIAAGL